MIKRYYSSYTGKQIDEAVKTIVENQIGYEDLSPELVAEIKSWVTTGEGGAGVSELVFDTKENFPRPGNSKMLYIDIDKQKAYYWINNDYKEINSTPDSVLLDLANAKSDIIVLNEKVKSLENEDVLIKKLVSDNTSKIEENLASIQQLTTKVDNKDKEIVDLVTQTNSRVQTLEEIVGSRKEGDTRNVFDILLSHEETLVSLDNKIENNTTLIENLNNKIPEFENNILSIKQDLDSLALKTVKTKYEVVPVEGLIVDYRDTEVRLNTQRVVPTHQSVGAAGNPNMYYVTFKAYAPEGAVRVIEGNNDVMDEEASDLVVDKNGRKYAVIWAAIANYANGVWTKWGDNSTLDKYFGFLYSFHWLDENDNIIQMDKVRVILTNDNCHTDLVPDVIARRIDEKIKLISGVDLNDYYTKDEVDALFGNDEIIDQTVSDLGYVNEVDEIVLNGGNA